jgi:hypothetical protein
MCSMFRGTDCAGAPEHHPMGGMPARPVSAYVAADGSGSAGGRRARRGTTMTKPVTDEIDGDLQEMFVQVGTGLSCEGGRVTLFGLSPSTVYFADRPDRVVGHITNEQFVKVWGEGPDSFVEDPPNAALCFIEPGHDRPSDVIVVLYDPELGGDSITYRVEILDGELPAEAGPCTLFIDPFCRPVSPGSIEGLARHLQRRIRRRLA